MLGWLVLIGEEVKKLSHKKFIIPAIIIGMLGFGLIGRINMAQAQTSNTIKDTIIDKLTKKFNLKKDDVKAVFDETRQERLKQLQNDSSQDLDNAVKAGVITKDQKQKILDKQSELEKQRQQKSEDLQKWYKDNGIDQEKLRPYLHHCGRHSGRGHDARGYGWR